MYQLHSLRCCVVAITALLAGMTAHAHHSLGMFDMQKTTKLQGTVSRFEWTNPHAWVWVSVANDRGELQEWGLEMAALSMLRRGGYTKDSFKAGDKVSVELHRVKDGRNGGAFVRAIFADGRMVGRAPGVAPPAGGPPGAAGPTEN
jgi:hypothetical protein